MSLYHVKKAKPVVTISRFWHAWTESKLLRVSQNQASECSYKFLAPRYLSDFPHRSEMRDMAT
jgi:hypothetical protein